MGVDNVELPSQSAECPDDAGHEADCEQWAAVRCPDPAMDLDSPVFFLIDRISGDGPGDDVDTMAAAHKLDALGQGLPFGSACERMEVADDVTDTKGPFH